jgi:hypothetical protein
MLCAHWIFQAPAAMPRLHVHTACDPSIWQLIIEPSPNAGVNQEDRTRVVVALIGELVRNENRPVVLVGHSLGGP